MALTQDDSGELITDGKFIEVVPEDDVQHYDRITCQMQLHHEHFGDNAHSVPCSFSQLLNSKGQPWPRRLDVGETPINLSQSWVESPGMIVIENRVGRVRQVQLSAEQKVEEAKKILLVYLNGVDSKPCIIRPGRFMLFEVGSDISGIVITSQNGPVPTTINVLPE